MFCVTIEEAWLYILRGVLRLHHYNISRQRFTGQSRSLSNNMQHQREPSND